MYIKHFGLTKLPFENVSDPAFFFDQGDHARIYGRIMNSLQSARGLSVVTGPAGAGKTMLSKMIIFNSSDDTRHIWMAEPPENSVTLFLFIALELGLNPSTSEKTFILRDIRDTLIKIHSEGNKCLLIIDESQMISDDVLDGVRLLNNLEQGPAKLVQILLLGQEEMMAAINRPEMESFRQRIATLETLGKMSGERIRRYILHRIHVAGGQESVFSDIGLDALVSSFKSGSTPRVINSVCHWSLNRAFEKERIMVDIDDVNEAVEGMGLPREVMHYRAPVEDREDKDQVPSNGEYNSAEALSGLHEETACLPGNESEGAGQGHEGVRPEPVQGDRNISEINDTDQKGIRAHCRSFLHMILGKTNGTSREIREDVMPPEERETEDSKEIDHADIKHEKPEKIGQTASGRDSGIKQMEETKPSGPAGTEQNSLEHHEKATINGSISDRKEKTAVNEDSQSNKEETGPSSEWVTIDSGGKRAFNPADFENIKPTTKKEIEAKLGEWVTMDTKRTDLFRPGDRADRRQEEKKEIAERLGGWVIKDAKKTGGIHIADAKDKKSPGIGEYSSSSEWVTIDRKGTKSINLMGSHMKHRRKEEKLRGM